MANDGVNKTWEARVAKVIRERETVTDIGGQADLTSAEESYFDVLELIPDRSNKAEKYLLSGNDEMLALQASLLLAIRQMLGGGGSINLDKWIEDFEDGFPKVKNKPKYLSDIAKPWGKDKENRPKITRLSSDGYELIGLYPDRKNLEEFYVFAGNASQIIQQVHQFWAVYCADVGGDAFVGYPIAQYLRQQPKKGIYLNIMMIPTVTPSPRDGFAELKVGTAKKQYFIYPGQVSIPFVKKSAVTYSNLREICGGSSGIVWGKWQARAYLSVSDETLSTRGLPQMVCRGNTKAAAEKNLDRFLALTEGKLVSRSCTEIDLDAGVRKTDPRSRYIDKYSLFPGWVWIENAQLARSDDVLREGRSSLSGKRKSTKEKLLLWPTTEPNYWSETADTLLRAI